MSGCCGEGMRYNGEGISWPSGWEWSSEKYRQEQKGKNVSNERRTDLAYEKMLPADNGIGEVSLPVQISQVEHRQVHRSEKAPRWACWVRTWFTRNNHLRVSFTEITGGSTDMEPSYVHEYASPEKLKEMGLKRHIRWCESRDDGRTWQMIKTLDRSDKYLPHPDDYLLLRDGTLLGVGGLWAGWDYQKNAYDDIGQAMVWRSNDEGETWSSPVTLNDPKKIQAYWCHPKQLRDGTIVLPAYGFFDLTNKSPQTDAFLFFSSDGGRTWSEPLLVSKGIETMTNDEPDAVELENGDLLVIIRHANVTLPENGGLYMNCGQVIVKRTPTGWQPGEHQLTNMGFRGFPAVLRTRDNILICTGSIQKYNFSIDNGQTWSQTGRLFDPQYPRQNHYPILTELADGRIISVYHYGNHWPFPPPEDEWIHSTTFRVTR